MTLEPDADASCWGLHAYEDPDLPAPEARPMWRRECLPGVLRVAVVDGRPAGESFDLDRFAGLATAARGADGSHHVLLSDGFSSLRIDADGPLLGTRACLAYQLEGLASVRAPLETLSGLLHLWEAGRLPRQEIGARGARLTLLLRAWDALASGANQREIASVMLGGDARLLRWRTEVPSLRLRAQRLVRGARAMAEGGYRRLLL